MDDVKAIFTAVKGTPDPAPGDEIKVNSNADLEPGDSVLVEHASDVSTGKVVEKIEVEYEVRSGRGGETRPSGQTGYTVKID